MNSIPLPTQASKLKQFYKFIIMLSLGLPLAIPAKGYGKDLVPFNFKCKTTKTFKIDQKIQKVEFTLLVDNTENPSKAEIPDDFDKFITSVSPKKASYFRGLGENGGAEIKKIGKANKDALVITGDSDGFYQILLVLYKDSGFKRGYVSITKNQSGPDEYSTLTCD